MSEPWDDVRPLLRAQLLDVGSLVRAVAAGRRRGVPLEWRRAELRPVSIKGGVRLQVTTYDERHAHTSNHAEADAGTAVDALLSQGFGNWHVETADEVVQVRITKKGDAQVHRESRTVPVEALPAAHDRVKPRMFDVAHPDVRAFLTEVGVADKDGRVKPSKQDKYRQVEEFVRQLDIALDDARAAGVLPDATADNPWRVVDLGCGHAYLTVGAYVWLARVRGIPVRVHGVDVRDEFRDRNAALAASLGWSGELTFEAAAIADSAGSAGSAGAERGAPDVVIALHACDTATDDALARAVEWDAAVVLAAPCCHHDLQAQVSASSAPHPYTLVARHGLLRERLLDVLTDTMRASLLRTVGYRVDAVEFVSDEHTQRNLLLRAVRTGAAPSASDIDDYDALVSQWQVVPALSTRIAGRLALARGSL